VATTKTVNHQLKSFKSKVDTLEDRIISIRTERSHDIPSPQQQIRKELRSASSEKERVRRPTPKRGNSVESVNKGKRVDSSTERKEIREKREKSRSKDKGRERREKKEGKGKELEGKA